MNEIELKLLIVEDDERTIKELERILKNQTNFEILSASTPSKALELASGNIIDLVLLDLKLPEMSGLELVKYLREKNEDILITMMTGYGEDETPVMAKEEGIIDFIEKPIDLTYLLATLRFQAREAKTRKVLRNTLNALQKFIHLTDDGIVVLRDGEVIASNPLGINLFKEGLSKEPSKTKDVKNYEHKILESGNIVIHHFKDISKVFEEARSKTREEMARLLSHELHNCLTPVKLWLEEIESLNKDDIGFENTLKKAIKESIKQIEKLKNLTKKIKQMVVSKNPQITRIKILDLVEKVVSSLSVMIENKKIDLKIEIDEKEEVESSFEELYQAIYNLILNSIEASKGGGEITIIFKEKRLYIKDTMGGLPEELENEPFKGYLTTKEDGTGLGLIMVRELLNRARASIEIKSERGKGVEAVIDFK